MVNKVGNGESKQSRKQQTRTCWQPCWPVSSTSCIGFPISVLYCKHTHTRLTILCPGLAGWAGTRKTKPMWILIKQETASGSGIDWTICKSAPSSRQITTLTPHHSICHRPDALPAAQRTASKHWRQQCYCNHGHKMHCFWSTSMGQTSRLTDRRTDASQHYLTTIGPDGANDHWKCSDYTYEPPNKLLVFYSWDFSPYS